MKVTECAVISSKTRESAESIGTSVNAMLSRISRITQTGFNEDDDTKLNDVAKALNTVGIALTDQTGNFRDFGTILDEIAVKWDTLDDQTQAYIANTVGGVRQQSRFFNLMNGYAESMDLYEQSLEAAGTAQSKFNLYLESNQATLDKFRTTLEGLWITVVDSDSLMSIVKAGTSFIELLDSMVQKFGTLNSALLVIIPLVGVRLAWAFRSAYVEVVKLIATGASKEVLATGGIFTKWAVSLTGVGTAAKGATVGMTGLTIATAGLTLGIGLLVAGVMWWANESKKAKEAFADALNNSQKLNDEVKSLNNLIKKQEELIAIENKSVEQKEELIKVQRELAQLYPELATGIDEEGNKIAENLEMTKQLTEEKRKLLEQELLVIKTTADTRLPQLRQELADMQDEAQRIQDRLTSGDVYETSWVEGYEYQIDVTEDLKNKLLELVSAQRENYEEITNLEDGVRSYNQILEENAERHKWLTVETLALEVAMDDSQKNIERVERELKKLGFTSEDTANIISGNIDLVKEKYKELDMQQIINLQTIENLDATQKQAMMNMLENSRQATKQLVEDTKARITAIKAEMTALSVLAGGKVANVNIMSKKGELDPKSGLLSNLSTIAQNKAIDAQRELVQLEGSLKQIDKALTNVSNISTKQISGIKEPKKEKKKKEEYKAEADRYQRINLELDKNNILLQKNKILQELAGDDLVKKLELMEEEVELNRKRQKSLNELNNERRKEALELEKSLSGQGFKFAGEGDGRMITNLDKIQGKSKEVEEQFNRYIQLQKDELPKTSQEWWNLKSVIDKIKLDRLTTEFELADQSLKSLTSSMSDLEYEAKLIEDSDIGGKAENIGKQLSNMKDQVFLATAELENMGENGFAKNSDLAKAFEERQVELNQRIREGTIAVKEYEDSLVSMRESLRQQWVTEQNNLQQDQQNRLSALDSIQEKIVQIIRKRGEEEKKALDEAHKSEMDSLEKRHKERKKKYQEDIDNFKKTIQDKIDALGKQYEEEDYLEKLNEEREVANRLQKEIDVLSLDDSLTARNKTSELRKQLADQNEKIAKTQQQRERDLLKKSLQDQLKDRETNAKDKEDIADNLYENEKKRLEEEHQINKEFLDKKYSDEKVYAEARESIMRGQVEVAEGVFMDIYDAFVDFEDKFGKGMGILGDIIKNDFTKQLKDARQAIRDLEYESSNLLPKYSSDYDPGDDAIGWRDPRDDYNPSSGGSGRNPNYGKGSATGQASIDNDAKIRADKEFRLSEIERAKEVIGDRLAAGMDVTVQEKYLRKLLSGSYKHGGKITNTGLVLNDFHGTQSSPEWIFNDSQLKQIISDATLSALKMPMLKMPGITGVQGSAFQIDNLINIEGNVDEKTLPKLQRAGNDIAEVIKDLNKGGNFRPLRRR